MSAGADRPVYVTRVPASEADKRDMLAMEPPPIAWEYLLFAFELREGIRKYESDWRDYSVRYSPTVGQVLSLEQVPAFMTNEMSRSTSIVHSMMQMLEPGPQERAFGAPGEQGDRASIEHFAGRLADSYGQLVWWGLGVLAVPVPMDAHDLMTALAQMASEPIQEIRDWASAGERDLEAALVKLANGSEEILTVRSELILTIGEPVAREVTRQLAIVEKLIRRGK
jgi:hypothetical protein